MKIHNNIVILTVVPGNFALLSTDKDRIVYAVFFKFTKLKPVQFASY